MPTLQINEETMEILKEYTKQSSLHLAEVLNRLGIKAEDLEKEMEEYLEGKRTVTPLYERVVLNL